jgi:hypothetical protein
VSNTQFRLRRGSSVATTQPGPVTRCSLNRKSGELGEGNESLFWSDDQSRQPELRACTVRKSLATPPCAVRFERGTLKRWDSCRQRSSSACFQHKNLSVGSARKFSRAQEESDLGFDFRPSLNGTTVKAPITPIFESRNFATPGRPGNGLRTNPQGGRYFRDA